VGDDNHSLVWAAGVAALLLVALLVYAVVRVSDESVDRPAVVFPSTSVATTPGSGLKTPSSSTSYSVPRVTTSQEFAPPAPSSTSEESEEPDDEADEASEEEETTIFNPYATTTTGSAGAI